MTSANHHDLPPAPRNEVDERPTPGQPWPETPLREPSGETTTLPAGTVVGSYRVVRLAARGGMGEVYLARDVNLGRKVALKLIRPGAIGDARAVANFLREARITAQFSHPHIVTLYGAGEWEGRPYVALEFLEGQTLRERMEEQRLGLREILRIGHSVAQALVEAHHNQVLHRDLKPENVFLPRDGRLRVVDFGLAQAVSLPEPSAQQRLPSDPAVDVHMYGVGTSVDTGLIVGTPDYMSPEQWKGLPCSPATDVWALGLVLYELLSGRLPHPVGSYLAPFSAVCSPEPVPRMEPFEPLPAELDRLVHQCVEKDPDRRPSGEEVIRTLHELLYPERSRVAGEDSPFRGLLPFSEEHADVFYGRDDEVAAFIERLRHQALLPVVGPSGAGKSSFIQAGVIPRLREHGRWIVLRLRPGRDPFAALASRLVRRDRSASSQVGGQGLRRSSSRGGAPESEAELAVELARKPSLLGLRLQQLAETEDADVLLLIDQTEEVYTLVSDLTTRRDFMLAICSAADDAESRVRVVLTLRDDFIVRLAETPQARDALGHVTVLRGPGPDALRDILDKPLQRAGYRFEDPALLDDMIAAVGHEPASLPLVQVTATRLWDERDRTARVLRRSAYHAMGGVEGALARQVDAVLDGLTPQQHQTAREIFLRLVTPDRTRRVVPRDQLLESLGQGAEDVLRRLVSGRAVVARRGRADNADGDVELVHESLIRSWDRLVRWLEESREEMSFLAEVGQAAELWEKRGRPAEEVWRGPALHQALARSSRIASLPVRVRAFLDAGERVEKRRSRTRRFAAAGAFAALAAAAAVLALQTREARSQRVIADQQRVLADQRRLQAEYSSAEALREGAAAALFREDMVEARAKVRLALETVDAASLRSLWSEIAQSPLRATASVPARAWTAAFLPGGRNVAALDVQGAIHIIDARTGGAHRFAMGDVAQVAQAAFSADGSKLVSTDDQGRMRVWDLQHETLRNLGKPPPQPNWFAISQDGSLVASTHGDGSIHLWKVATGEPVLALRGHRLGATRAAFSPDGRILASGGLDNTVRIWDLASGTQRHVMKGHDKLVSHVGFSANGQRLVSSGWDGAVRVWNVSSGRLELSLDGHASAVFRVRFSPDGRLLASVSGDKTVRIWDAASGACLRTLRGHGDQVYDVDFSADGRTLLSLDGLGTIRFWDLAASAIPERLGSHTGSLFGIDFSPDGASLASASRDGTIRIWSVRDGSVKAVLRGHDAGVLGVDFSADSRSVVSGGNDHTVRLWDLGKGTASHVLSGHQDAVVHPAFSPDGKWVASPSNDGTARIWSVASADKIAELRGHTAGVNQAEFSPDGRLAATGSDDGTIRLWDVMTWKQRKVIDAHPAAVYGPRFSADGKQLVSGGWDGTVRVWNANDGLGRVVAHCGGYAFFPGFDSSASRVAAPCADGTAMIVDLSDGSKLTMRGHVGHVTDARFSPDDSLVATAGDDGTLRLWRSSSGRPAWYSILLRAQPVEVLTHRGWESLRPGEALAQPRVASWRMALEKDGRLADEDGARGVLCVSTWQSTLELWDTHADVLLWSKPGTKPVRVAAAPDGCVVLSESGALEYLDRAGARSMMDEHATAFSLDGQTLATASGQAIKARELAAGSLVREWIANAGAVTALARVGGWVALGRPDGDIDLLDPASGAAAPQINLPALGAAPVVRLASGPGNSLVAAFDNGLVGVWDLGNGARIRTARLHGRIADLHVEGHHVLATSELGDYDDIDLGILDDDYCTVLRDVWQEVPMVWRNGRAVEQPPPTEHRCNRVTGSP